MVTRALRHRVRYAAAGMAAWLLFALPALADMQEDDNERQYKIEAAFLYNFFNYITWPGYGSPQAMNDPQICVYGEDPIQPSLEYIQQKIGAQRHLRIRELMPADSGQGCDLIFIRQDIGADSFNHLAASGALMVSDAAGTLGKGGMIELARDGDHMHMKINQYLMEKNHFTVSSRLLSLAEVVR